MTGNIFSSTAGLTQVGPYVLKKVFG